MKNILIVRSNCLCCWINYYNAFLNFFKDCAYSFFFKQKTAYEISACLVGSEMCIRDRSSTVINLFMDYNTDNESSVHKIKYSLS